MVEKDEGDDDPSNDTITFLYKLAEGHLLQCLCVLLGLWRLLLLFPPWQQLPSLVLADEVRLLQETPLLVLNLEPLAALWILTLEELSSLAFWLGGDEDGGNTGVGHLHVGQELVDGL